MKKGPGECMQIVLETLGIHPHNCECRERAREMDEKGIEWVLVNKDKIINWLRTEQAKRGWVTYMQAAANAVKTGLYKNINPIDPSIGIYQLSVDMYYEFAQEDLP